MKKAKPLSQNQFKIRISSADEGLPLSITEIYFTMFSGIKDRSQSIEFADPSRQKKRKMIGARDIEDVQVSAPYVQDSHQVLIDAWDQYQCQELQLEVQPVACGAKGAEDEQAIGSPFVLTGCMWVGLEVAEANRESNDIARITLTFTVDEWSKGTSVAPAENQLTAN